MAIDDNTTYGLTGAQVKDLAGKVNNLKTNAGAPTTATVGTVGQLLADTTNGKLYICTAIVPGTDPDPDTYTWEEVSPTIVQSTGTSTTSVMSQDATTNMLWRDPTTKKTIQYNTYYYSGSWEGNDNNNIYLGARQILGSSGENTLIGHVITGSSASKSVAVGNNQSVKDNTVAIGYKTWVFGDSRGSSSVSIGADIGTVTDLSVIIGSNASIFGYAAPSTTANSTVTIGCASQTSGKSAVAVGFASAASQKGEFNIGLGGLSNNGSSQLNYGHNGSSYRLLSGVDTPQDDHDAATKSYVDANSPTVFTTNEWNALWA